ncbi:MAG: hypothetical protein ABI704_16560 [Kofleriaceae bacterium]
MLDAAAHRADHLAAFCVRSIRSIRYPEHSFDDLLKKISEVPLAVVSENQGFWVMDDQYEANVRRTDDGGVAFDMPEFCAVCGSTDAAQERAIVIHFADRKVNTELWRQLNYAATGTRGRVDATSSKPNRISGSDFVHMQVPVCAQHRDPAKTPNPLVADDFGSLHFASYRFYKAFVVANHIVPPGTEELPAARVRT